MTSSSVTVPRSTNMCCCHSLWKHNSLETAFIFATPMQRKFLHCCKGPHSFFSIPICQCFKFEHLVQNPTDWHSPKRECLTAPIMSKTCHLRHVCKMPPLCIRRHALRYFHPRWHLIGQACSKARSPLSIHSWRQLRCHEWMQFILTIGQCSSSATFGHWQNARKSTFGKGRRGSSGTGGASTSGIGGASTWGTGASGTGCASAGPGGASASGTAAATASGTSGSAGAWPTFSAATGATSSMAASGAGGFHRSHICRFCLICVNNCSWRNSLSSISSWWIGRHALLLRFKRSTKGRQRNSNSLRIVVHWANKSSHCSILSGWNNCSASVVLSFSHPSWLPSQLQGATVQSIFCQKSCSISNHGTNTIPMCLLNFDSIECIHQSFQQFAVLEFHSQISNSSPRLDSHGHQICWQSPATLKFEVNAASHGSCIDSINALSWTRGNFLTIKQAEGMLSVLAKSRVRYWVAE